MYEVERCSVRECYVGVVQRGNCCGEMPELAIEVTLHGGPVIVIGPKIGNGGDVTRRDTFCERGDIDINGKTCQAGFDSCLFDERRIDVDGERLR